MSSALFYNNGSYNAALSFLNVKEKKLSSEEDHFGETLSQGSDSRSKSKFHVSENIKQLEPLLTKIQKEMIFSPNFANRDSKLEEFLLSKGISKGSEEFQASYSLFVQQSLKNLKKYRKKMSEFIESQPKGAKNQFVFYLLAAMLNQRLDYGNCMEMALLAFIELLMTSDLRVEVVELIGKNQHYEPDHSVLAVNRNINSRIGEWKDWGPDCYIFDAWSGEVKIFSSEDIPIYLKNFEGLDDKKHAKIGNFNPDFHSFDLSISKMWSVEDIAKILEQVGFDASNDQDGKLFLQILKLFDHFIKSGVKEEKVKIAKQIMAVKIQSETVKEIFSVLKSQLRFFLHLDSFRIFYLNAPKRLSVFGNSEITNDFFENTLTSLMVDELVKIAELFKQGNFKKANRKMNKLNVQMQEVFFDNVTKGIEFSKDQSPFHFMARVIYDWLFDQILKAQANGQLNDADAILSRLPSDEQVNLKQGQAPPAQSNKLDDLINAFKSGWLKSPFGSKGHETNKK